MTATIDELRALSRRSLRTYRSTMLAMAGMLVVVAVGTRSPWAVVVGGALVVGAAFVLGQERGEFRRVMRRIRDSRKEAAKRPT